MHTCELMETLSQWFEITDCLGRFSSKNNPWIRDLLLNNKIPELSTVKNSMCNLK